jgi:ferric-dicitrate binding protein FerR (iron transport regulator)
MNEKNELIVTLLHKSINGITLTETEKADLEAWISQSEYNHRLYNEVMNSDAIQDEVKSMLNYDSKALWKKITKEIHPQQEGGRLISIFRDRRYLRYAAAAVLLILISTTAYLMYFKTDEADRHPVSSTRQPTAVPDVAPGTEKAVLILDDGTTIPLDNAANGQIATQGNTTIIKEDGLLAYNADNQKAGDKTLYNTIKTARGELYSSLVLSDGSKIWLNASSSIRFPATFSGKQRNVEITGEVYFEIAKNPNMPFTVSTKGMKVEVLGTHFNINAYDDEPTVKTTLLEGAVKVTANGKPGFLKPGQQAQLTTSGEIKVNSDVNIDEAMAWKEGVFRFQSEDMMTIMRQVSRWYNVDVVFKDQISERYVVTRLTRNVPVSKLLTIFETAGGVHFEIDEAGKKIIVSK